MKLLLLAPAMQERILDPRVAVSERPLRGMGKRPHGQEQDDLTASSAQG